MRKSATIGVVLALLTIACFGIVIAYAPRAQSACGTPTEITLTTPDGSKDTITVAQITEVRGLNPQHNFFSSKAHAVVGETGGIQAAAQETREQILAMLHPCN